MLTKKLLFLIIPITLLCCLTFIIANETPWQLYARQDIEYIFTTLKENHPGWVDQENPSFKTWCIAGHKPALEEATNVDSNITYNACIQKYCNGFQDPHIYCTFTQKPKDYYWPEFICEYKNSKFIVTTSLIEEVPIGTEIIKCDELNPKEFMRTYIFPYFGNPDLTASWHTNAYRITSWNYYPSIPKIKNYTLKYHEKTFTYNPEWQPIEKELLLYKAGSCLARSEVEIALYSIDKNILWLQIPTFFPQTDIEKTKLHSVIKLLQQKHNYPIITFDLRGNGGGSSTWCTEILKALWGPDIYKHAIDALYDQQYSQWRASINNLGYLKSLMPQFTHDFSTDQKFIAWLTKNITGMKQALNTKQVYYTEKPTQDYDGKYIQQTKPAIAIVIDSYCDSVCLDFIDELTNFAQCTLFGQDTNADTNYVEARDVELPSKKAVLTFPIKVLRGRKRAYNQAHKPAIYIENICDTKLVQETIKEHMHAIKK